MRREKVRHIVSLCLLVLYVMFRAGMTVFPHEHILNGEKLVHSHPYSNANHTHTADQAVTIARLSSVQLLEIHAADVQDVELPLLYSLEFGPDSFSIVAAHGRCVNLRGPPCC